MTPRSRHDGSNEPESRKCRSYTLLKYSKSARKSIVQMIPTLYQNYTKNRRRSQDLVRHGVLMRALRHRLPFGCHTLQSRSFYDGLEDTGWHKRSRANPYAISLFITQPYQASLDVTTHGRIRIPLRRILVTHA